MLELEEDGQGYRLSPARVVTFRGRTAELAVSCTGPRHLGVKVRTTNPGLFHVSPHTASLGPGQQVTIRIRTSGSGDTVTNQQFQLSFLQTEVIVKFRKVPLAVLVETLKCSRLIDVWV